MVADHVNLSKENRRFNVCEMNAFRHLHYFQFVGRPGMLNYFTAVLAISLTHYKYSLLLLIIKAFFTKVLPFFATIRK